MIKLIVMDVDGTLTDGGIYLGEGGSELKRFNAKDGAGIVMARQRGMCFAIITGRESGIVTKRAEELGIEFVFQGIIDKLDCLKSILENESIEQQEVAYIGDDVNDLECLIFAGLSACPADAADEVKKVSGYVCGKDGGFGAVREFIEYIIALNAN